MNYNKLKEVIKSKGFSFRQLCIQINKSEAGFHKMIKDETMKVEDLEKISELLKVSPGVFFDTHPYNLIDSVSLTNVSESKVNYHKGDKFFSNETEQLKAEIANLRNELKYKDEMIELYRKISDKQ